jgi:hypothetical protein
MEVTEAALDLKGAVVTVEGDVLVHDVDLVVDAAFSPFMPKQTKGLGILEHFRGDVSLDGGRISDLAVLNAFFPPGGDVRLVSGEGRIDLKLAVPSPHDAKGSFDLVIEGARIAGPDEEISGDILLHAALERGELIAGRFDLDGTTVALEKMILPDPKRLKREAREEAKQKRQAAAEAEREQREAEVPTKKKRKAQEPATHEQADETGAPPAEAAAEDGAEMPEADAETDEWWMRLNVVDGTIVVGHPARVDITVNFAMRDSRPLLRFFFAKPRADGEGTKLPGWVGMIPNIRDIEGDASLNIGPHGTIIDDVLITGEKMDMMARIKAQEKSVNGQLYLRYGILHIGVNLVEGKTRLKLTKPKAWFIEQPEYLDSTAQEAPETTAAEN